ncbi:MAG: GntR family transcriptional regulator [Spongiibacteraceae bacterium]|jgi:GntR family transcriptional regulator of vanillate catabolism|nr:GntR family transcriptional regulator [Spongiibacteraceae bacterium]
MNTLLAHAVRQLREMILRGDLAPGQRVAEIPLAEALGMSRTPVRQALPMLAQEGLLAESGNRGYVVRGFSPADIADAIELRGALEALAARRVAEHGISRPILKELKKCLDEGDEILGERCLHEGDETAYADMNERFHRLIIEDARSEVISEALRRNSHIPFGGAQALAFDKTRLDDTYELLYVAHRQHHCIVEALERGQGARVQALMSEHAEAVKSSINLAQFALSHENVRRMRGV